MPFVLWLVAVILVVAGIAKILDHQAAVGIALIIVGCLVGPGGVSLFT